MNRFSHISLIAFTLIVILSSITGCTAMAQPAAKAPQGSTTSVLTQEQFTEIAENAMQGFANGDYAAWSRDWTDAMKGAIKEQDFLAYRQQVTESLGQYQSIASVEIMQGTTPGYVRWSIVANFEKGQMRFGFGFKEDGVQIEGVFPEAMG